MAKKLAVLLLAFLIFPGFLSAQTCDTARTDMNCDGALTGADIVFLSHIFYNGSLGYRNEDANGGDLNCDGFKDATDLRALFNCVHGEPVSDSCPPNNVRPLLPDPHDSIIIESKLVLSGGVPDWADFPYTTLKVWITNKDTITNFTLPLVETSVSGGAYALLAWPRNSSVFNRIDSSLSGFLGYYFIGYNNLSPDSFTRAQVYYPPDSGDWEPPNSTRKLFLEIKFDTVVAANCDGRVELDSAFRPPANTIQFVDIHLRRIPVNFVRGILTVNPIGDIDMDGQFTPSDVVLILNCVFLETGECATPCRGDVSCDGSLTSSDVVVQLNKVYLGTPYPCPP